MKKVIPVALFLCLPSLVGGLLNFGVTRRWFAVAETLRSLGVDILLLAPVLLLPPRLGIVALCLLFLPLLGATLGNALHIAIYKAPISPFAIQSAFETSASESKEFLNEFATLPHALLAATIVVLFSFLLRRAVRALPSVPRGKAAAVVCLAAFIAVSAVGVKKGARFLHSNTALMSIHTLISYADDATTVKNLRASRENQTFPGVLFLDGEPEEKRTYIFIIGESANRHHHSLYGYHRTTTPQLEAMENELHVFTNVISADTHTIPALRKTLLFHELDEDKGILEKRSIIALLRQAGFETYWLSNQTPNADGLTGTAVLAGDATYARFFNKTKNEGQNVSYDNVLLEALEDALADPFPKKAIFLHLIGSHLSYALRYPAEFNYFTNKDDIPNAPWRTEKDKDYINAYDNSIRYTDHIVSSVIKRVEQEPGRAFVIYFSDHGQEVYDSLPIRGQAARTPTRFMVDIPFLCWFSEEYRINNTAFTKGIEEMQDTPYTLELFSHTAADAARIQFDGFNPARSLFSRTFQPVDRLLPEGQSYDRLPEVK